MQKTVLHNADVVEQFTLQSLPFTKKMAYSDTLQLLVEIAAPSVADTVLDVACGPGLVLCAFAKIAKHTTGIDITPAMLERAKKQQRRAGLQNMRWDLGNAETLPYADHSFSIVVSRYSFHHFENPLKVLREMYRVCDKGGKIIVADVTLPEQNLPAFNAMEKLRDSSHTQALSLPAFQEMFKKCGLKNVRYSSYKIEMELEQQLATSFPNAEDADSIKQLFQNDLEKNEMGVNARLVDNKICFTYPINVYVGYK